MIIWLLLFSVVVVDVTVSWSPRRRSSMESNRISCIFRSNLFHRSWIQSSSSNATSTFSDSVGKLTAGNGGANHDFGYEKASAIFQESHRRWCERIRRCSRSGIFVWGSE
jgi:hypothetical protein